MVLVVIVGNGPVGLVLGCESRLAFQLLMSRFTPVSGNPRFK